VVSMKFLNPQALGSTFTSLMCCSLRLHVYKFHRLHIVHVQYSPSATLHLHARVNLLVIESLSSKVDAIFLASIAETLVRMDTREQNECHVPILGNYSMTSKSTRVCECNVALGPYCRTFILLNWSTTQHFIVYCLCIIVPVYCTVHHVSNACTVCGKALPHKLYEY